MCKMTDGLHESIEIWWTVYSSNNLLELTICSDHMIEHVFEIARKIIWIGIAVLEIEAH